MPKPLGVQVDIGVDGLPRVGCRPPSRVEDSIWDAVAEAIDAGWTPQKFRLEAAEAWETYLRDEAKWAGKELRKG